MWILVIFLSVAYRDDAPWTVLEFESKQACVAAAEALRDSIKSYKCISKRTGEVSQ